jgi:hypothetical protein
VSRRPQKSATDVAVRAATIIRTEARRIGMLRSVDATYSAKWLDDMADEMVNAAGHPELTLAALRGARKAVG